MKKFKKPDPRKARPDARGGRPEARGGRPDFRKPAGPRGSAPAAAMAPARNTVPQGRAVVGIHAFRELVKVRPKAVDVVWLRDKYIDHPELEEIHDDLKRRGIKIVLQSPGTLDRIAGAHQGIIGFTRQQPELDFEALKNLETATLIALDEVEDPHNLGAVMRTAWLFGAQGVITPEQRSVDLSPAVSKVAQGAIEHVPLARDSALPHQLETLKKDGFWILGLSHKATQDIYSLDIPQKVVWVLGSESSGLRKSVEGACDDFISIPQANPDASYNVSVAAAIALAETHRQRLLKK